MSLMKIPAIFLVTLAFQNTVTPPQPPAPSSERIETESKEVVWYTRTILPMAVALQWCIAFAEIATILACNDPSAGLSKTIISLLTLADGALFKLALSKVTAIGGSMIIVGSLIRFMTYRYLGRFFRYEASIQKDHQLIVTGPYSVVRHPSYTGFIISHSGWFLWQLGPGSWLRESGVWGTVIGKIVVLVYAQTIICGTVYHVLRRMKGEDDALRQTFGERWEQWAKDVPYLVIPGIY